jgi:hypothetical protein
LDTTAPTIVYSNHKNLGFYRKPQDLSKCQACWIKELLEYKFEIHHLPGKNNTQANHLSRQADHYSEEKDNQHIASLAPFITRTKVNLPLLCKQLHPNAKLLIQGTTESAGLNLYAIEIQTIAPGAQGQVKTGITIALPSGTYGRIAPRSGLAWKKQIFINAGVIDANY